MNKENFAAPINKNQIKEKGVLSMKMKSKKQGIAISIFKKMTVMALVLILCLSMAIPALAAVDFSQNEGTAADPAKAAITKILRMPINTTTPAVTFTFTFTSTSFTDIDKSNPDNQDLPTISPISVTFPTSDFERDDITGETKYAVKQTGDFLAAFASNGSLWTKGEGIYTFLVEENQDNAFSGKEGAIYSTAKYEIEVWVEKDGGKLYARYVFGKTVLGNLDDYYKTETTSSKVDPKPGTPGGDIGVSSQVIFTNKYWKTAGGGETDPAITSLEIIKNVTGTGSPADKYFIFNVKVIKPALVPDPDTGAQKYKVYVLDSTNAIVTSTDNYATLLTDTKGKKYIEFTTNAALDIKLKNGQRLVFADLHVGANVEVFEKAEAYYIPKYTRTFPDEKTFTSSTKNADWGFPNIGAADAGNHYVKDGAGVNKVTYTNTRVDLTPTGLDVSDLPYVILIGVAAAGLIGFVLFRAFRKNSKDTI